MSEENVEWTLCGYDRKTDELVDELVLQGASHDLMCELLERPREDSLVGAIPVSGEALTRLAERFGKAPSLTLDYFVQVWSKV